LGLGLAALLAAGVVLAVGLSVAQRLRSTSIATTAVRGVIGSEKQPFFSDPAVQQVFRDHGLNVTVDTAGSRQIATTVDLARYDFAFPAGVPAAEKIRQARHVGGSYAPFYTPMAIATFQPILQLLLQAQVVKDRAGYYTFDMQAYLALVAKNTRWSDLPNNNLYPTGKSILITSTDVRKSNSAAMYLSIASYVANGNNVVQDASQAASVLPKIEPIFLRQGLTSASTEEPFDDYISIGIGKTPLVLIYEAQFIARAAAGDGSINKDMVLMYPGPDVLSKHTLVPLNRKGDEVGRLLQEDSSLQKLAVKYGFRTNNAAYFNKFMSDHKLKAPSLVDVIEPPTYENLEAMISTIEQHLQGA
jgi:hypothetical protein